MRISYINCDFCHVSTLTDKEAAMFTNTDRKALGGKDAHICNKCIVGAWEALNGKDKNFYLRATVEGRHFKEVKS
ncbi:TPA: hypothetical protein ACVNQD_002255 [Escherichia coli]